MSRSATTKGGIADCPSCGKAEVASRQKTVWSRGGARYRPQPRILIVCEDSKSGRIYLQEANQHFRSSVRIAVVHSGYTDPRGIVRYASRLRRTYEQIVCAIDRDEHPNFDEAVQLAATLPNVSVCASYPAFEYWLLLHFA